MIAAIQEEGPPARHTLWALVTTMATMAMAVAPGCGGQAASQAPAATAADAAAAGPPTGGAAEDDESAGLMEHHRYHHHAGLSMFVALSLQTLGAPPEQRPALEKIRADLRAAMKPARDADASLLTTLADALVAPTPAPDAVGVNSAVARVVAANASAQAAYADALNQLHATLTPEQRAVLADKVDAHFAVWQRENAAETDPAKSRTSRHVDTLAADLGLSAEQTAQISAALASERPGEPPADHPGAAERMRAFGAAFRAPTFDARTLPANPHLVGWGAAHLARVVEVMRPVLTPEQRALLAQRLRDHAAHDPVAGGNS
ncbi:MAG TPA: Spy/CpxP family protein refolding chaperone [Polyangia bacterium]|nr:Spy/CpxP family protein refolding chaperone [Polyangia bacterium]